MINRRRWLVVLFLCVACLASQANAQSSISATISSPQMDKFPLTTIYLDVHDAQGGFVHGIVNSSVHIIEDNQSLPVTGLNNLRTGVQLVIAIDPSQAFSVRNPKGKSRLDLIREALDTWAQGRQGSNLDDLSLVIKDGPESTHLSDPVALVHTLDGFQLNSRPTDSNVDTLMRAVDIAANPTPRQGMERAVLAITSPMGEASFNDLISQAKQENVRIFIWAVTPKEILNSKPVLALTDLANQTGGKFIAYSDSGASLAMEDLLEPLRNVYMLTYESQIRSSGTHHVAARINAAGETISTTLQSFQINIQPPDVAFISPVTEITRQPEEEQHGPFTFSPAINELLPKAQEFHLLIDFRDGHTRQIVSSSLVVDGKVAAENMAPPFDKILWDLNPYEKSGDHVLQLEVKDSLGLVGKSIEYPIKITVNRPRIPIWIKLSSNTPLIIGIIASLAVVIFFVVLVLNRKITPHGLRLGRQSGWMTRKPTKKDRFTTEYDHRLRQISKRPATMVYASLTHLAREGQETTLTTIPIQRDEVTLGQDGARSTIVLDDPSVAPLHARLKRKDDGIFWLTGEIPATSILINEIPVPPGGAQLKHGDYVTIGKVNLRFILRHGAAPSSSTSSKR